MLALQPAATTATAEAGAAGTNSDTASANSAPEKRSWWSRLRGRSAASTAAQNGLLSGVRPHWLRVENAHRSANASISCPTSVSAPWRPQGRSTKSGTSMLSTSTAEANVDDISSTGRACVGAGTYVGAPAAHTAWPCAPGIHAHSSPSRVRHPPACGSVQDAHVALHGRLHPSLL